MENFQTKRQFSKLFFLFLYFPREALVVQPRLASHSLCSKRWAWVCSLPVSVSWVPGFKYIPPCLIIFVVSKDILVLFYPVFMCVFSMKNSVHICTYTYVFKYLYESSEMLYVKQNGPGLLLPVFWTLLALAWTELILKSHDHLPPKPLITVPEWKLKIKSCFNEHHFTDVLLSIIMTLNTLVVFFLYTWKAFF